MMLTLDDARAVLLDGVRPLDAEALPLADCGGRTLARDVLAVRSQPPDPVSAMDGYALRDEESRAGTELLVIGESPAGAPFAGQVTPGTAVRIATGGVVPPGADRVVMQEIVAREGDRITITETPGDARFVRPAGCDFAEGQAILDKGATLTAARLALAAAANQGMLHVHALPRVAILPSGDELREPGNALGQGDVVNSAAYAVERLVEAWGGIAVRHPILPDDRDACRAQLAAMDLAVDVIVPLGGASVGDRDAFRPLFAEMQADIRFDRVAVQPGKPTWHARFPEGRLLVGLPGNPASAFVCAHLFLKPLLDRLCGREGGARLLPARLGQDLPGCGPRETYLRGSLAVDGEGRLVASAEARQDSNLQLALARSNILIRRLPKAPPAPAGTMVEVLQIEPLG